MPDQSRRLLQAGFRRGKFSAIFFVLPAFCLALIGVAWYEVNARVEREYQIEIDSVYRESGNLITSFEDHVRRNLLSVDDTLLFIKLQYENQHQQIIPGLEPATDRRI